MISDRTKIRDGVVTNRAVYVAIGFERLKQVLGLWIGPTTGESAKFWLSVLSELKGRGVADVCIVCCDGLTGLPDAISVVWPAAIVQLCVVRLIRASLRYASRKYWTPLTRDLRPVCTAADEQAAAAALEAFAAAWEDRYPAIIKLWRAHWAEFTPFLAFPPEVRRVIYTTNLIESMVEGGSCREGAFVTRAEPPIWLRFMFPSAPDPLALRRYDEFGVTWPVPEETAWRIVV